MKLFYSWQSDLPNKTNRSFILIALEKAAKSIRQDASIEVEPVVDRDTSGVPGSPDISSVIFQKIAEADAFVADVSIINNGEKRPMPNPNVLIELGYAMSTLGTDKIIMVLNTAFGQPETLPFDLRMRRVVTYTMAEEDEDRSNERRLLEKKIEANIRTIIEGLAKFLPEEIMQAAQPVEILDPVKQLERDLTFKQERYRFHNSEAGVMMARQQVERLSSILQAKAKDVSERSSLIRMDFEQKSNNQWVLFSNGISLSVAWTPPTYANVLENSQLYISLWRGRLNNRGFTFNEPNELRNTRYKAELNIKEGVGWLNGRDFHSSEELAEIWFQRLLDEIGKR